ncbi:hypothetical protein AQI88_09615 [Streptomyces cellostaticus]|uniref:Uncharacterized protein n=1 Tax=Streptomyces cellostaticus TaxID=67285 RepID=A0A117PXH9_9ACTN|nr:hypothetical protein [Streptomyces cellostaticus]KUM96753.1 hypothetical protein AQI88_09615 [Streptomyces cellostaticus]GHI05843.1 hypothetical protein Scel_41640 [Streptomyces cellostaticus]
MAGLEIKYSGELFLANGQQSGFAYDFRKTVAAGSWIRPCVNQISFSDTKATLEYVSEYAFTDSDDPVPPYGGLTLRATGNSDFFFSMVLVTP